MARLRDERLGLALIVSSLAVIALICGLLVTSQLEARRAQNRSQGVGLVRLLSSLPYERYLAGEPGRGPLDVVGTSQSNPDFAYAAISDRHGRTLVEVTAPGVIIPPAAASGLDGGLAERTLEAGSGQPAIREFRAPLLVDGNVVAQARVGFFQSGLRIFLEQASFLGTLALPIFLLAPVAYFLIRREIRPVSAACAQIQSVLQGGQMDRVQVEAAGEIGEFIRCFNRFVELTENRMRDLNEGQSNALASSRVLAYQKSRIEAVLDTLPDATLLLDNSDTVIFANSKLEAILGVQREDAIGRKTPEWCSQAEVAAFLSCFEGSGGRHPHSESIEFSPTDSPDRRIAVSAHPLNLPRKAPTAAGTLVVFRDVTRDALARRAQGEFVSQVAHELKAPLNVLSMYSESLLDERGDSDAFRIEACNVIRDEVERLAGLVSTLLTIAQIESGEITLDRQRVKLAEFLEDALATARRNRSAPNLGFTLDVPPTLGAVHFDKDLVRIALNNLLTNAIKYNREDGEVVLAAEETPEQLVIHVTDTGIGISEEEASRVFEKFFRSDRAEVRKQAGHGLGLHLAREIAILHGGDITIESVLGERSRFSILLPKVAALQKG